MWPFTVHPTRLRTMNLIRSATSEPCGLVVARRNRVRWGMNPLAPTEAEVAYAEKVRSLADPEAVEAEIARVSSDVRLRTLALNVDGRLLSDRALEELMDSRHGRYALAANPSVPEATLRETFLAYVERVTERPGSSSGDGIAEMIDLLPLLGRGPIEGAVAERARERIRSEDPNLEAKVSWAYRLMQRTYHFTAEDADLIYEVAGDRKTIMERLLRTQAPTPELVRTIVDRFKAIGRERDLTMGLSRSETALKIRPVRQVVVEQGTPWDVGAAAHALTDDELRTAFVRFLGHSPKAALNLLKQSGGEVVRRLGAEVLEPLLECGDREVRLEAQTQLTDMAPQERAGPKTRGR